MSVLSPMWEVGAQWRDLRGCGCHWATVHTRLRRDLVGRPSLLLLRCALHVRTDPQGPS